MYDGMIFAVHDRGLYETNKESILALIKEQNASMDYICDASVVEYKDNLYLIIDGYASLLEWQKDNEECFAHKFLELTKDDYKENKKHYYGCYNALEMLDDYSQMFEIMENNPQALSEEEKKRIMENAKEIKGQLDVVKEKLTRNDICGGFLYGDTSCYALHIMFDVNNEAEILKAISDDIFKATTEKMNINDIKFVETLYSI